MWEVWELKPSSLFASCSLPESISENQNLDPPNVKVLAADWSAGVVARGLGAVYQASYI